MICTEKILNLDLKMGAKWHRQTHTHTHAQVHTVYGTYIHIYRAYTVIHIHIYIVYNTRKIYWDIDRTSLMGVEANFQHTNDYIKCCAV